MASDTLATPPNTTPVAHRWQFRLWHLFALTTHVAIVMAAVSWWGTRTLPITIGAGLMWLNFSGAFAWLQSGRRQAALLLMAWITFIVSMFLPCETGWTVSGYDGAWLFLWIPFGAIAESDIKISLIVVLTVDLANLLQALLPLQVWRLIKGKGRWLGSASCLTMIGVWVIAENSSASGYCLWCASFLIVLVAIPLKLRTLLAMIATMVLEVGILLMGHW